MSKKLAIILVVAALILLWNTYSLYRDRFIPGAIAPEFSLQDADGNIVALSDYKGSSVIVHFWATWCPTCAKEMPGLIKFQKNNPDVVILAISENESFAEVNDFLGDDKNSIKVLMDKGEVVAGMYKSHRVPESYFINEEGIMVHAVNGRLDWDQGNLDEPATDNL